jgi:hypothetical protein
MPNDLMNELLSSKRSRRTLILGLLAIFFFTNMSVILYTLFGGSNPLIASKTASIPAATPTATPLLTPTDQLTVALDAHGTTAATAVGTNIQGATEVTPANQQPAESVLNLMQNWNQPMLRLHFGFREENPLSLPEAKPGSWDFSHLDPVIATLRSKNISFFLNVRTAPPWMFDAQGNLPDQNFPLFATYMARLVSWYNKGGFTDDNGVYHKSNHANWIHVWEIWNEPKSAADIPVDGIDRQNPMWMAPDRFARLYDMTVDAMRAVDPTIITGGPALGSWADENNFWLQGFIEDEHAPLDFLSFHFYAARYSTDPDSEIFNEVTGSRFLDRLTANRKLLDQVHPGQHIPIWITEMNLDENSTLPSDVRGTSPVEYAFLVDALVTAEYQGIGLIDQFNAVSSPEFAMINYKTYQYYGTAWFYQQFSRLFPAGSTLLPVTTGQQSNVKALAMISPDHKSLHLLVGNIQVASQSDKNGAGVPKEVRITLTGSFQGLHVSANATASVWNFNAHTPPQQMPASQPIGFFTPGAGQIAMQVPLMGYGAAMISIPLS